MICRLIYLGLLILAEPNPSHINLDVGNIPLSLSKVITEGLWYIFIPKHSTLEMISCRRYNGGLSITVGGRFFAYATACSYSCVQGNSPVSFLPYSASKKIERNLFIH